MDYHFSRCNSIGNEIADRVAAVAAIEQFKYNPQP